MDLISREDLERGDSGSRFIPDSILEMIHPEILKDASATYAKLQVDYPNYEFGMVYDSVKGGMSIYWKRVV